MSYLGAWASVALGLAIAPLGGALNTRPRYKMVDDGRGPQHLQDVVMTAAQQKRERRRLRNLELAERSKK